MKRKLFSLKNTRAEQIVAAETALKGGDTAAYEAAMTEVERLNGEIGRVEKLLDEQNRFSGGGSIPPAMSGDGGAGSEDPRQSDELKNLLSSESYKKSFFQAIKEGVSSKHYNKNYADLFKAMTLAGGDPAGSDGGFLVPSDFETRVIELSKELVDLSAYAHTESVTSPIGWRNVELSAARARLAAVGEGNTIPKGEGPKFKRVNFSCKTYADRIAVSGDLMENADGLMEYLAAWFAARFVATKNGLVLDKLNTLEFAPIEGASDAEKISGIKSVLNKGLRTAVSKKAILLTNQNGYDEMDNMADGNGRPFLKPDVSGDFDRFKNRPVVYGDADLIEDIEEDDQTYAPVYIGDLASFVSLFIRKGMRMDVTNVGGDAWANGGYEVRVMCSMDCQTMDETAVIKCGLEQL